MTVTPSQVPTLAAVTVDLYRDIHKGIRSELFAVTVEAGRTDPGDDVARAALAAQVHAVADLLDRHAHHEDAAIGPHLASLLPHLHERIERDHVAFEGRTARLLEVADAAVAAEPAQRHLLTHHLHLDLAGFTSAYLAHQDVEEREVMPALEAAIGPDEALAVNAQIVGSIPPEEMARSLALMLPVMNVDDRTEMLGGMQATAPAEVFAGVWGLAGSVLSPADHEQLGRRLGLA